MKRVLIISDNETLTRHLMELSHDEEIKKIAKFDFCYSTTNKQPNSLIELGMREINLKNKDTCKKITEIYQTIISLHCKQIFPSHLVKSTTCINIHPGLNPYNRGWYPQVFSIINKKPVGATIHLMDEQVDHGPVIAQKEIKISNHETSLDVYNRVIELEKSLISQYLKPILENKYEARKLTSNGNYNSINDFKNICNLNMNETGTLREHIDLLRALSHGDFDNAFFIDEGRKVFVRIVLKQEETSLFSDDCKIPR